MKATLSDVYKVCKKWLYLKNTHRIDVLLAVHRSREMPGTKLWLIVIGGSGASKSELLKPLDDGGRNTHVLQELTPNTLVSGNPAAPDLAPQLKDKTVLIYDLAILLNLQKDAKAKVWAQLRELYDGNAGKNCGSGKSAKYSGLNITLMGCSTSAIDNQILIFNELGTRELLYRIKPADEDMEREALMSKVLENEQYEELMRQQIHLTVQSYLASCPPIKEIEIAPDVMRKIKDYVMYCSVLRTSASLDSYTGECLSTVEPEHPTRLLKQFKRLYQCLKNLDPDYSDSEALEVLREVRDSCCNQDRLEILSYLVRHKGERLNFTDIGSALRLGNSTVKRHLSVLWSLKLVCRDAQQVDQEARIYRETYRWFANMNNSTCRTVAAEFSSTEEVHLA